LGTFPFPAGEVRKAVVMDTADRLQRDEALSEAEDAGFADNS